jgi:DNA polymerase-1
LNGFNLLLVDEMALAYRAFHAIPPLTARDGTPTNALLGFVKTIRQLRDRFRPTHIAVVCDGGSPASRLERFPEYKAQRAPMPDELARQLPLIEEFLEGEGIPVIRIDGQEADDVMATLAARAESLGGRVRLATNDKDLFQVVTDRVTLVAPTKEAPEIAPADVLEKTGVPPRAIPAWLALTGDAVDNIPGVPGVGPKTAARLLEQFGTLESLWANLDRVPNERLRSALIRARQDVQRNFELVTLDRATPGVPPLELLRARNPDVSRLRALFDRLDMSSLAPPPAPEQMELL